MMNVSISPDPFDPLGPPGRGLERIRDVLRLAGDFTIAELHNANRVDRIFILQWLRYEKCEGLSIAFKRAPLAGTRCMDHRKTPHNETETTQQYGISLVQTIAMLIHLHTEDEREHSRWLKHLMEQQY